MKPIKETNIEKAIIYTKILDESTILVVNSETTIRYLDILTLEENSIIGANIIHASHNSHVVDFTSDSEKFVSISQDTKESRLYETKTNKLIGSVSRHQGEVSCVGIDPKDRYAFSCGYDGKSFAMDLESGKLAFTLPIHTDAVNDIAFSGNGQWVATASYDKTISLYNIAMKVTNNKLKAHSEPIIKISFLSDNRLFGVDKSNSAIIWDTTSGEVITRLEGIHDDITQVVSGSDNKFLFVGTKLGYILVYDLKSYKLIDRQYIKLSSTINTLNFFEDKQELIIGTDSGDLIFYNIFEYEDELDKLFQEKNYNKMQDCIEKNSLLEYAKSSLIVVALWDRVLQKATEYLGNNETNKAIKLFDNFKSVPSKRLIINSILEDFTEFNKFVTFVKQRKIPLAYSIVNAHPIYKETKIYKDMELEWDKTVAQAKKYLQDPKTSDMAGEILSPYRGVSEKTKLIQELLVNAQIHRRFKASLAQKKFKLAFELIKLHPFLKKCSEYEILINYSDSLYTRAHTFLNKGDTHSAIKLFTILLDFEDFAEEAKNTIIEAGKRQKFFDAVQAGNIIIAYEYLDSSPDLLNSEDGKKLQKLWENDLNIAKKHALNGDVDGIRTILEKYMVINSKNTSMAAVLSLCYITQLKTALQYNKDQKLIENGIKNYVSHYGLTKHISILFEIFKKKYVDTKLNLNSLTQGNIKNWKPSMIVKSILD